MMAFIFTGSMGLHVGATSALAPMASLRSPSPQLCAPTDGPCAAATWPTLQQELDALPVFVLANAKGEPLQQVSPTGTPILAFFADLFRAEAELANANKVYPEIGLSLLPVGLGDAFARTQAATAVLIPSQNEVSAAALDPQADAGVVPLFGCTKMMKPSASNPDKQVMPLFMSHGDTKVALDRALSGFTPEGMEAETANLDILCIPLAKAVDLIVTGTETRFEFVAPSKSVEWVKSYAEKAAELTKSGLTGEQGVDEAEEEQQRQAMFEQLISQRQDVLGQTGGIFPGE